MGGRGKPCLCTRYSGVLPAPMAAKAKRRLPGSAADGGVCRGEIQYDPSSERKGSCQCARAHSYARTQGWHWLWPIVCCSLLTFFNTYRVTMLLLQ